MTGSLYGRDLAPLDEAMVCGLFSQVQKRIDAKEQQQQIQDIRIISRRNRGWKVIGKVGENMLHVFAQYIYSRLCYDPYIKAKGI